MDRAAVRRGLGRFGVWLLPPMVLATPLDVTRRAAARIEELGYGSLWTGELPPETPVGGPEAFSNAALVLGATTRLTVGVGVANIANRHAVAMRTGAATLARAYPGRFILGLGGQRGPRPLAALRAYLDELDAAAGLRLPDVSYPRVLGALGPKALALSAERADGAHPFLQPVEHTALARTALGAEPLLIPHQAVVLESDATRARALLRGMFGTARNPGKSPYADNYRRLGYDESDLADGRSDRLVDALLAYGDEAAVADRVRGQLAAGADHVLIQPIAADLPGVVDQLARLAPALGLAGG